MYRKRSTVSLAEASKTGLPPRTSPCATPNVKPSTIEPLCVEELSTIAQHAVGGGEGASGGGGGGAGMPGAEGGSPKRMMMPGR